MNFNEEMERELSSLCLGGKVVDIPQKDKGTPNDFATLERKIAIKTRENEVMMEQSIANASDSILI